MTNVNNEHSQEVSLCSHLLAKINSVASLSEDQLSTLSESMNVPISSIQEIFDFAEQQSANCPLADLSKERLEIYRSEGQLGYLDDWIDPNELPEQEHPLLLLAGGMIYRLIAHVGLLSDLDCIDYAVVDVFENDELPSVLSGIKTELVKRLNDPDFSGYVNFRVGDIPVAMLMVDLERFIREVRRSPVNDKSASLFEAVNFVGELLEGLSGANNTEELKDYFSVLANTALMVGWISPHALNEIGFHYHGIKRQLTQLITLIADNQCSRDSGESLYLLRSESGEFEIRNMRQCQQDSRLSLILIKRMATAELYQWCSLGLAGVGVRLIRIR